MELTLTGIAVLALTACGTPDLDLTDTGAMAATEDPEDPTGDSQPPLEPPGQATGEEQEGTETGEPEADTDECSFIDCPEDTDGVIVPGCDIFAQDCPEDEKCMPYANDGGGSWNATQCVPISDNPAQPGDTCYVEGSGTSGYDDCDIASMCWDVDPETNAGTCVPMCAGDPSAPLCEDPDAACTVTNEGVIALCLPSCDPLVQDCAEGQACYPVADEWVCAPDASGEMGAAGDSCEFINVCSPGNICVGAAAWPDCQGSVGCCSPVCDLEDVDADAECPGTGQTCQPWYEEGDAPPGYESVGACALPA
ncbi:MAG: ribulose phosphate epimerase [Myxococcota bacterium]